MVEYTEAFVGIDAAKSRNAIAIAEAGRAGEIRYLGEVDATPQSMRKVVARLAAKYQRLYFCYEAGPTGYGLYRQLTALGHDCIVVAPSLIPRKPGGPGQDQSAGCDLARPAVARRRTHEGVGPG
jgi:transposase